MYKAKLVNTNHVWPIGTDKMFFQRTTDRYAKKGTISANRGFLSVKRNAKNGRFVPIN